MSLQEHVAKALYERDHGLGWDDAPEVVQDVFFALAETALSATAGWLELVSRSDTLAARQALSNALRGVGGLIRRAVGEDPAPPPPPAPEPESAARTNLREVLEGYGA